MNLRTFNQQFFKKLPDTPGVYFFLNEKGEILYIGKATSLRDRVKSYFMKDILSTRGPKIARMLELSENIKFQKTDSVLEALILESELIKKYQPPYNTDVKDDKSWNFVVITKEKFPRVLVERGKNLKNEELGIKNRELGKGEKNRQLTTDNKQQGTKNKKGEYTIRAVFGPFPSGGALKDAVKIIRKIFPFRDICIPLEERNPKKGVGPARNISRRRRDMGGCFNHQIGLCPGVCTGDISSREYAKTIRNITLFFEGRKMMIIRKLEREMNREAKALRFERANEIKKTLFALGHIQDVALLKRDMFELPSPARFDMRRIEAYDVAHLGGSETVGVMTVVVNGEIQKKEYRKFIIHDHANGNDLVALEELLRRRLKHTEWRLPSLIVVDGSDLQRHVAESVLKDFSLDISVVSVVKDEHHKPKNILGLKKRGNVSHNDILLANSEAHRYAISFHRKRRGKAFLT